jgi:hypothetical protein
METAQDAAVEPKPKETPEVIRPSFNRLAKDCCAEVEKLAKIIEGHDRQLTILTKAILSPGVLQGSQVPTGNIADEGINRLVAGLCERESSGVAR